MQVKLELLLSRTVTVNVADENLHDLSHLVQQIQSPYQDHIHSVKIVESNGQNVGTSLDRGSALEVSGYQNIAKFRQLVPSLLQKLRRGLNKGSIAQSEHEQATKSETDHVERLSHEEAWKTMARATRHAGYSTFGGRY